MKTQNQGKTQEKKTKKREVIAKPVPEFFEIPYLKVEEGNTLRIGESIEFVVQKAAEYHDNRHLRTLGRQSKDTIYVANYLDKGGDFGKGIFHRSLRFSVKGISRDYDSLDKKLKEAGH